VTDPTEGERMYCEQLAAQYLNDSVEDDEPSTSSHLCDLLLRARAEARAEERRLWCASLDVANRMEAVAQANALQEANQVQP
jgi:hypothetical protein